MGEFDEYKEILELVQPALEPLQKQLSALHTQQLHTAKEVLTESVNLLTQYEDTLPACYFRDFRHEIKEASKSTIDDTVRVLSIAEGEEGAFEPSDAATTTVLAQQCVFEMKAAFPLESWPHDLES